MAIPLRKTSRAYETAIPRQPERRQTGQNRGANPASRRLVSRLIRSNAAYRRTIILLISSMILVFVALAFVNTSLSANISRVNYQVNTMLSENEHLLLENDKIRGQIAELRSLERIAELASRDLGMIKNDQVEYMVVSGTVVAGGKLKDEAWKPDEEQRSANPPNTWMDKILIWWNR
ncbi:MAG: septum formation initiator family protein [Clostridiales bacterium]|nr:septum formation initiator family protein [Clostridiales bacterium]